ncbi:RNA helicase [Aphelenchoides bicaudatus]|nr:RNA helicase [Aphelenchoides bicaudatus]
MSFKARIGRLTLGNLKNEEKKPVEKPDANVALPSRNKPKDGDKTFDILKSKHSKKHAMRTSGFQHEEIDELTVGSQFKTNRDDELNNSVVYFTKKSGDPEKQYDTAKVIAKPKAFLSFEEMELVDPLYHTLRRRCPDGPTAIQAIAIPSIMESNCDFVIRAPTGSGKTAAFLVPLINRIEVEKKCQNKDSQGERSKAPYVYAIIICPSRDLAVQLTKDAMELTKNTDVNVSYAIGETLNSDNKRALRNGADIVVGTLGRLNSYVNQEKLLNIERLLFFVADEADSLERIEGFVDFFNNLKSQSEAQCQCILSSATLGFETNLALKDPVHILVKDDMPPPTLVHGLINIAAIPKSVSDDPNIATEMQPKCCYLFTFFKQHVLKTDSQGFKRLPKIIVYVNGKRKADSLAIQALRCGFKAFSFHGDKTMDQRTTTIERMKNNEIDVLIATNILARGLNLKIDYVINYDLPVSQSSYVEFVHRVGRTARVGNYGIALTMFNPAVDAGFAPYLKKMLIHYNMEVPGFIEQVLNDYINNMLSSHDGYMEQQIANQQKEQLSICNRSFLAGKMANKTFA